MFIRKLKKTHLSSLPLNTPITYSTHFRWAFSSTPDNRACMAPSKHIIVHSPQPMHLLRSILATLSFPFPTMVMASAGHQSRHFASPLHLSLFTTGFMSECICCFPPRLLNPMDAFLMAPPKPMNS